MTIDSPRRIGRPASSSAADTRQRILDGARRCFATVGFESSTNRRVADDAGISAAAIYHYFASKTQMYAAVYDDVQRRVYERFEQAAAPAGRFLDKLDAVLDAAHELNRTDPTLALFIGAARVDVLRNRELAAVVRQTDHFVTGGFFDRIIDVGVLTGEVRADQRDHVITLISTLMVGLTDAASGNQTVHRDAIEAIKSSLRGTLLATTAAAAA
jgi:AcrR family transcriptional regulator